MPLLRGPAITKRNWPNGIGLRLSWAFELISDAKLSSEGLHSLASVRWRGFLNHDGRNNGIGQWSDNGIGEKLFRLIGQGVGPCFPFFFFPLLHQHCCLLIHFLHDNFGFPFCPIWPAIGHKHFEPWLEGERGPFCNGPQSRLIAQSIKPTLAVHPSWASFKMKGQRKCNSLPTDT